MAKPFPIELPPGFFGNGTPYSAIGRFSTGNLVRFRNGFATPVGGWQRRTAQSGAEIGPPFPGAVDTELARNIIAWIDNFGGPHIVIGTNAGLYHVSSAGLIENITPVGFIPGSISSSEIVGYGVALYGVQAYGTPRSGSGFQVDPAASWSFTNYGQVLHAQFRSNGPLYKWQPGVDTVAVAVAGAPMNSQAVLATTERVLMTIHRQPRLVSWSDVEDTVDWVPTVTNQAGSFTLGGKGDLQSIVQVGRDVLILSERDAHVGRYLGPPFVYGFDSIAENCGTWAPNSVVVCGSRAFWVGDGFSFWTYDGSVRRLPSEVDGWLSRRFVPSQISKTYGFELPRYREVWWLFQSQDGADCDSYVVFNYDDATWFYGAIERTVGLTPGPTNTPVMVDHAGLLWNHEITGNIPVPDPWIETGPIEVADGEQITGVKFIYPDFKAVEDGVSPDFDGNATISILGRDMPSPDAPELTFGPYPLYRPVPTTGARGRELRFRVDSVGSRWVFGRPRLDLVGTGRR